LVNNKDDVIDEGEIKLVRDRNFDDCRVINGRSCIVCHSQGINSFSSNFQKQVGLRPNQADLGIFDKDPRKALELQREIRRLFGTPNFDDVVKEDQRLYEKAVKACNGLPPETNALLYKLLWVGYNDLNLDMSRAVYEIGLEEENLKKAITLRKDGRNSGVLLQLLAEPPISIRRDHWEEAFPELMLLSITAQRLGKGK